MRYSLIPSVALSTMNDGVPDALFQLDSGVKMLVTLYPIQN